MQRTHIPAARGPYVTFQLDEDRRSHSSGAGIVDSRACACQDCLTHRLGQCVE
jgi:hypothetical protein